MTQDEGSYQPSHVWD